MDRPSEPVGPQSVLLLLRRVRQRSGDAPALRAYAVHDSLFVSANVPRVTATGLTSVRTPSGREAFGTVVR